MTVEWNARPKHWSLPEFRCRTHQTVTKRPFSPPFFSGKTEKKGPPEATGSRKFATTSQSAALTAPLEGEPRGRTAGGAQNWGDDLSVTFGDSFPGRGAEGCAPIAFPYEGKPS